MKLAPLSAVLFSQFVKADAGSVEAQYDARLCAVYGAYLCALKDGNKTQLMMVQAAAEAYKTPKACRELTATPDRTTPAASRASKVYQAYGFALQEVGIPALLKGADGKKADTDAAKLEAEKCAVMFVDLVTAALTPEAKAVKTDAEKEAEKAKKEAAAKKAEKEAAKARQAEIDAAASVKAATMASAVPELADMAKSVEMAITAGTLADDAVLALYEAILLRLPVELPSLALAEA